MGTANFKTQPHFDLCVIDFGLYDEKTNEIIENDFEFYNNVKYELEKINYNLKFFDLTLKDGYYDKTQIYVESIHDCDFDEILKYYDGQWCYEEFGVNKYILERMLKAEIFKINNVILPKLIEDFGFEKLVCIGNFSNGEALYEKVKI